MAAPRLTERLLRAMEEALNARIAGGDERDIEGDGAPEIEDYQDALAWVWAQIEKREVRR